jgi:hypothetical protein
LPVQKYPDELEMSIRFGPSALNNFWLPLKTGGETGTLAPAQMVSFFKNFSYETEITDTKEQYEIRLVMGRMLIESPQGRTLFNESIFGNPPLGHP